MLQGASPEACLAAFEDAAAWIGVWAAGLNLIPNCFSLQGASPEACLAAFEDAAAWFGVWAAGGHGDVAPDEMARLIGAAAARSRGDLAGGPAARAAAARWLLMSPETLGQARRAGFARSCRVAKNPCGMLSCIALPSQSAS